MTGTRPERGLLGWGTVEDHPGAGPSHRSIRVSSSPAGLKLALLLQVYRTTDAQDVKVPLETLPKSTSMLLP